MSKVLKVIEVLAESNKSWEDAAGVAVRKANKTLKNIKSVYIKNFEGQVVGAKIVQYRLNAKITFELD